MKVLQIFILYIVELGVLFDTINEYGGELAFEQAFTIQFMETMEIFATKAAGSILFIFHLFFKGLFLINLFN